MQVGVFAYIKNEKEEVLLVQDASREEKWTMPGGGVEFKELVNNALTREVREEIGVGCRVQNLLGVFSQQKSPGVVFLFEVVVLSQNFILDKNECEDIKYFSLADLEKIKESIKPAQYSMIKQMSHNKDKKIIYNDFSV